MLANNLVMKTKTPRKPPLAMIALNPTSISKRHHKTTTKNPTYLLEGADTKPIAIKFWKNHNLVISYTSSSTIKMKCLQSRTLNPSLLNLFYSDFVMVKGESFE